jgi:DNA polymerase beta
MIDALNVLSKNELKERNVFKARAYTKVIGQLKNIQEPIYSVEDLNKLNIEGVGKSIKDKLDEIILTGQLKAAIIINNNPETVLFEELIKIYGVGPVKAKALIADKKINIKSIDDLRKALITNPELLNDKQTIGLKYIEDIQKRIPREEIVNHDNLIKDAFVSEYNEFVTTIVGSYRRGLETSGDIDVLVTIPSNISYDEKTILVHFKKVIENMSKNGYITDILAFGSKKCMAFVKLDSSKPARRLDILYTVPEEYPYALLYFTGSDKFNIKFRRQTLEQGYSLSEHGVKKINNNAKPLTPIHSEKDLFEFFGIAFVEPKNR